MTQKVKHYLTNYQTASQLQHQIKLGIDFVLDKHKNIVEIEIPEVLQKELIEDMKVFSLPSIFPMSEEKRFEKLTSLFGYPVVTGEEACIVYLTGVEKENES